VLGIDVVWTGEFAGQGWIRDVGNLISKRQGDFIPSTVKTAQFNGKTWAVPFNTNAGFLFYRTDKIKSAPSTWQDVYNQAKSNGGIVYQGAQYEGLTVNYLELLYSAGGKIVDNSGTKLDMDKNKATQVLTFMADGLKSGAAPKANVTYMEEESRRAFEGGTPAFMRNWPYAYALAQKDANVKGKFKVVPQPAFQGAGKGGVLGGHNSVISVYSKNPGAALKVVDYVTSLENNVRQASKFSLAPVLTAAYQDPAVKKALPFSEQLQQAVSQAHARPVSPVYPQISQAIYKNVNAALAGQMSPQDALKKADSQINSALATF
jgi:multiple sugar transport system substrate-binding protein